MATVIPPQSYLDEYIGYQLITAAIVFIIVDIAFVGLRLWARKFAGNPYGWDDLLIIVGLVFCIGTAVDGILCVKHGGVGRHLIAVSLETTGSQQIKYWLQSVFIAAPVLYSVSAALPKLAILILYLKIFRAKSARWGCYITAFILIMTPIVNIPTLIWQCQPISFLWDKAASPNGHCFNAQKHFIYGSLPNIVTDVIMLLLPIPTIYGLQSTVKVKVGLFLTFLTGSIGLVTSIIRFAEFFGTEADGTWDAVSQFIWLLVEPGVYLWASCLIACRPLASYVIYQSLLSTIFNGSRKASAALSGKSQTDKARHRAGNGDIELDSHDDHSDKHTLVVSANKSNSKSKAADPFSITQIEREVDAGIC